MATLSPLESTDLGVGSSVVVATIGGGGDIEASTRDGQFNFSGAPGFPALYVDPAAADTAGAVLALTNNFAGIGGDGSAYFANDDFQIDADGNTTIDGFLNCQGPSLVVANMPVGTIAAPPAGLVINQLWLDTTTSATQPIVRLSTVNT